MRYFLLIFLLLAVAVISVAGFRGSISRKPPIEVFPDMDRQQKLRPQEPNAFLPGGISSQPFVTGTVPRSAAHLVKGELVASYADSPCATRLFSRDASSARPTWSRLFRCR